MPGLTQYQKEALDYSTNILLTANAGSGKTLVLSKRFIEIILNNRVNLDNIVAITFTDKAAGELNKRIAIEIQNRIETESDERRRKKLEETRRQLVSANISTIHSFCVNILREFAPEAGIDVNFNPIDRQTSDELIELCIDESFNNLINNPEYESNLKYLFRFFGSKTIVRKHLKYAIAQRKIIEHHLNEIYLKSDEEIAGHFQNKFENIFRILFEKQIDEAIKEVSKINDYILERFKGSEIAFEIATIINEYNPQNQLAVKFEILQQLDVRLFTQKGEVKNRGYLSKNRDEYEHEIGVIEKCFSSLRPFLEIKYPEAALLELVRFGKTVIKIYEYVSNVYLTKKHQKGYLDFEDILLFTQKILELDEVGDYLRKKYKYIMIDEYQDTNEIQYKIFMPILDNLKHGNLFVVGDEKQSIYMFRDADIQVFNRTRDEIKNAERDGKLLNLPHSFRMAPQLVLFTNKLFTKLFKAPEEMLNEVYYSELICAKPENEISKVEFLLADKEKEISEAELVAGKILELIANKEVELKEIGILCRKRNLFEELETVFVKKNIPFLIVGGKGFYQRQTIYDVYNYLSFVLNRNDDAALIGILRSPFYTISDAELFEISLEEGNNFFEKLVKRSAVKTELQKIINRLNEHSKLAFNTEIYTFIRTILLQTGYWAVAASKRNAKQEIANLEKLLVHARLFSQKSFKNLYDFTVALRESIDTLEDEGQAQVSVDENSVKLLTIHQAKGLEFKAVFLYGCNGFAREDSVKAKTLSIDKDFGFLTKVPLNNNYFEEFTPAPIVALHNYIIHRKNLAEIKRLLYVAVTRAMNYLFISASHKEYKPQRDSFFQLFCEGMNLDFTKEEIRQVEKVTFMKNIEDKYEFYEKDVELNIKFINDLVKFPVIESINEKDAGDKKFLIGKIEDIPEREIISATKISMYTQCPVKYRLTYDLGYSTIFDLIKKYRNDFEFNSKEDDELKLYADVKGRVIHNVLKENTGPYELDKQIDTFLIGESLNDSESTLILKRQILNDLGNFYLSEVYKQLIGHSNFRNELEVYCEEGSNYLYGIIDKLIIEKDKLIIVDYKTDDISIEQVKYRADDYFPQLKFYSYILSKLYKEYTEFELRLAFIKHADSFVVENVMHSDFNEYRKELNEAITKIVKREYKPNLNHCSKCRFVLEGNKCVMSF